ncbi:MAG TPA: lactate utilization protein [Blastocatellia bacterium]|jgi:L-lactate dehydrogenase complex protein LldG
MATKEDMLARIRRALGRAEGNAPEPLPAYVDACSPARDGDLVELFCKQSRALGAQVARVRSADEIKEYIAGLAAEGEQTKLALSDGELTRWSGLGEYFSAQGIDVLHTLGEYAEGRGHAGDLMESYKRELVKVNIGVTSADYAIAETGTLVLVSGGEQHRLFSLVPPVHVCLLEETRIIESLPVFLALAGQKYYSTESAPLATTFITGPSRTADIELSLTLGVHGPRELHTLLIGSR